MRTSASQDSKQQAQGSASTCTAYRTELVGAGGFFDHNLGGSGAEAARGGCRRQTQGEGAAREPACEVREGRSEHARAPHIDTLCHVALCKAQAHLDRRRPTQPRPRSAALLRRHRERRAGRAEVRQRARRASRCASHQPRASRRREAGCARSAPAPASHQPGGTRMHISCGPACCALRCNVACRILNRGAAGMRAVRAPRHTSRRLPPSRFRREARPVRQDGVSTAHRGVGCRRVQRAEGGRGSCAERHGTASRRARAAAARQSASGQRPGVALGHGAAGPAGCGAEKRHRRKSAGADGQRCGRGRMMGPVGLQPHPARYALRLHGRTETHMLRKHAGWKLVDVSPAEDFQEFHPAGAVSVPPCAFRAAQRTCATRYARWHSLRWRFGPPRTYRLLSSVPPWLPRRPAPLASSWRAQREERFAAP